jgi:hypothetical protein
MQITIAYDSSWRNSFLDGDNNEPLPKKGRKYKASITNLKQEANYIKRDITLNTVMGILNRLIGDQRKLYQSRKDSTYFFSDLENKITHQDYVKETQEMTYLRNMQGSFDQNSFTGSIKMNDPIFNSDYSSEFWGVLSLDFDNLCRFIVTDEIVSSNNKYNPLSIVSFFETLNNKPVENSGIVERAITELTDIFGEINYFNAKNKVVPLNVYCSALYLQLFRLSNKYDMTSAITNKEYDTAIPMINKNKIKGISKRSFTKKDFMDKYTTGDKKRIWGNPYIHETFVKGEGKTRSLMTKASGRLEIYIDISKEKAKEIRSMIRNAGVSSFYLGKKGLAYVEDIKVAEVKK